MLYWVMFLFFQAEDGIRDLVRSRGLGDVYKRQAGPRGGVRSVERYLELQRLDARAPLWTPARSSATTNADVLAKVRLETFDLHVSSWKDISEDTKGLIRMLPKLNPEDSHNAKQTPNYEWITSHAPKGRLEYRCKQALLTTSGASVGRLSSRRRRSRSL